MSYSVTEESLASISAYWVHTGYDLKRAPLFVCPGWLRAWWQVFGSAAEPCLLAVRRGESLIGIAPLLVRDKVASFMGSSDVCDYLDFIIAPGRGEDFFPPLLEALSGKGIRCLDLSPVRPDAAAFTHLADIAGKRGYEVIRTQEDISLEMDLPSSWDAYLEGLSAKQRHEVRRKLRRLLSSGKVDYHFIEDKTAVNGAMDTFLRLFTLSRQDKAEFLTARMESFFRQLADNMAENGLRLGVLELDAQAKAMIMCFDYHDGIYLYNSGYDPAYDYLSVGLLSKALAIKDSIERGRKKFDFLKGAESYKYHLGGKEVPLYRCQITFR